MDLDCEEVDPSAPKARYPPEISRPARLTVYLRICIAMLDVAALIISILALFRKELGRFPIEWVFLGVVRISLDGLNGTVYSGADLYLIVS